MGRIGGIAWALAIVGAMCMITGAAAIVGSSAASAPAGTQDVGLAADYTVEPWPSVDALASDVARDLPQDDAGNVTIILAARWGYLSDPFAALLGRWQFNDTRTGGGFQGQWRVPGTRIAGELEGRFTLPPSGNGEFHGRWTFGSRPGGFLAGDWTRVDDTHGTFLGRWNFTDGRPGGAVGGRWVRLGDPGGAFRGYAIQGSTFDPVDWDGFLKTTNGTVQVLRTVRFERGDEILPRTDRQSVRWNSTTTVNWDGIIFALRVPRGDPGVTVTLNATQAQFSWNVTQLARLHVRERVDRAGHEIEVAAFALERHTGAGYARIQIGIRWGNLSSPDGADDLARTSMTWDGFAQITTGGLIVERTLSFERGDSLLPRNNRLTVVWQSTTTSGWDGIVMVGLVPLDHAGGTYFTVHAGGFTHVFTLGDLPGDHTFDAGNGNQVEVRAVRG